MSAAPAEGPVTPLVPTWTFADRMRKIRRDVLGMEQAEFAAELGVTKAAYAAWESGRNEPRTILATARRIEALSGVPAVWLLGMDDGAATTSRSSRRSHLALVTHPQVSASPHADAAVAHLHQAEAAEGHSKLRQTA